MSTAPSPRTQPVGLRRLGRAACLGLLMLGLGAASVSACPSCIDARNGKMRWFAYTTYLLTALPVVAIGGGAWWLRRWARESDAADEQDRLAR